MRGRGREGGRKREGNTRPHLLTGIESADEVIGGSDCQATLAPGTDESCVLGTLWLYRKYQTVWEWWGGGRERESQRTGEGGMRGEREMV